jgi:2,4-dienoyl-CoA reductase-like NADH-dependent reductase (Old Yellow Enzyme family)/thioredoxin reductase
LELTHGGTFANVPNLISRARTEKTPYGPIHEINADGIEILPMPEALILEVIEAFGICAKRAKDCGFNMVSIHGGHGWFLHQFMAPSNNRRDRFGGSLENRMRVPLMVLDAIRKAVGPGFPIEFRMSGAEFTPGGYGLSESVEMAKLLAPKVDLLHVSAGIHDHPDSFLLTHPNMFVDHGCNVFLAAEIKKHVDVPVAAIGGLSDPAMMEEIIASGKADVVEIGRGLMADPYLPMKAQSGRAEEIVKCMRCFTCMHTLSGTRDIKCALNPEIGREMTYRFRGRCPDRAGTPQKQVMVAGGGPAGLRAAIAAAEQGYAVTLCEAGKSLGGQLNNEARIPFKKELYELTGHLSRQAVRLGVKILLETPVTPALVKERAPDILVVAIGAEPIIPEIPGINGANVLRLDALQEENPRFGRRVAVLGGGLVGCETAIHLMQQGKEVTVVEMETDYARDASRFHKEAIRLQFQKGINLELGKKAVEVTDKGLRCLDEQGNEVFFPADTIFCAAGLRSREAEVNALRDCDIPCFPIGDCLRPGQVTQALEQGAWIGQLFPFES